MKDCAKVPCLRCQLALPTPRTSSVRVIATCGQLPVSPLSSGDSCTIPGGNSASACAQRVALRELRSESCAAPRWRGRLRVRRGR
jgi:hypothetical protein